MAVLNPNLKAMYSEPSVTLGGVSTAVSSLIALYVAFGGHMTADQQTKLLAAIAALAPIVTALWVRYHVYSPKTVNEIASDSADKGAPQVPPPPGQ